MKGVTLPSLELCQAAGALLKSFCLFPSWARDSPNPRPPDLRPIYACALLQPFMGCGGHKYLQNQQGNTLLRMGRKIIHVFAGTQIISDRS